MGALGTRVRALREDYGFSTEELARLADMGPDRLSAAEATGDLSTSELARIADALAVNARDLLAGELPDIKRSTARFRAPTGLVTPSPYDVRLLARGQQIGRVVFSLQRMLATPKSPIAAARHVLPPSDHVAWREGYQLGARARATLAVPDGPIPSVQDLIEDLGAHVAAVRFDSHEIEAASLFEPQAAPVILLNSRAPRVRHRYARRAILAHELCHLLHDGGETDLLTVVSRPEDHSYVEARAGGFAPSFIAPENQVARPGLELPDLIIHLGETWGLSYEGAVWHAKNLRWITPDDADHLIRRQPKPNIELRLEEPRRRSSIDAHPVDVTPSDLTQGLLSRLVAEALDAELISAGRAAEILHMS